MTNKKTKGALISSLVAILLCFAMLLGTTYAWFTDTVVSGGNIIKSGNLDIEMLWAEGTEDPAQANWKDASEGAIFNYDKWEPGYVEVRHVKIENKGNLALKYKANIVANGDVSDLTDVIDVYYVDPAVQVGERTALSENNRLGTLTEVLGDIGGTATGALLAGESDTITIALKMQEAAGNEYQNKSIGSDFSFIIFATQYTYEFDSFDDQYDADAKYNAEIAAFNDAIAAAQAGDTVTLDLSKDAYLGARQRIVAPKDVNIVINGNGHTIYADGSSNVVGAGVGSNLTINDVTIVGKTTDNAIISQNNGVGTPVEIVMNNVTVNLSEVGAGRWPISFGGNGTATLTDCTITGAGLPSGDYADGTQVFAGAQMNVNLVNTKLGSIMLNGSKGGASATMTVDADSEVGLVILEAHDASVITGEVEQVFIPNNTTTEVMDALAAGANVTLSGNLTTGADDQVLVSGNTLDGNGNTLDATNSGINGMECVLDTRGGVIKNLTIIGPNARALGSGSNSTVAFVDDLYIDNVTVDYTYYALNGSINSGHSIYVTNSTLNGWISYAGLDLLSFENTTLAKGNTTCSYGLGYLVVYGDTLIENCTVDTFYFGVNTGALNNYVKPAKDAGTPYTLTINNTYVQTADGLVKVTVDNYTDLLTDGNDARDFGRLVDNVEIYIDGVRANNWS